jgi:hypothetical protein
VERRIRELAREKQLIKEAENRISSLTILVEDVKAAMTNLSAEQQRIQEAVEKASELRFLLGEVEYKLNLFKQQKEQM